MPSSFVVIPAAYVILRRGAEVLLQRRHNTGYMDGYWAVGAAGHVEADESVHAAAVRESREELGVEIEVDSLVPLCAMHRTAADGNPTNERIDVFFTATTWEGSPHIVEPTKAADLRWCDLGDLPPNVVPHERFVLDGLRNGDLPLIVSFGFAD
ncbi:MAG: NUDIX domain-containing protein [Actinomycetota bacterium]